MYPTSVGVEKLGVLTKGEVQGKYKFVNELFRLYVIIESLMAEVGQ